MPLTLGFEEVPHASLVKENKITMMFESKNRRSIQKNIICALPSKPVNTFMAEEPTMVRKQEHPRSPNCHSPGDML